MVNFVGGALADAYRPGSRTSRRHDIYDNFWTYSSVLDFSLEAWPSGSPYPHTIVCILLLSLYIMLSFGPRLLATALGCCFYLWTDRVAESGVAAPGQQADHQTNTTTRSNI